MNNQEMSFFLELPGDLEGFEELTDKGEGFGELSEEYKRSMKMKKHYFEIFLHEMLLHPRNNHQVFFWDSSLFIFLKIYFPPFVSFSSSAVALLNLLVRTFNLFYLLKTLLQVC